MKSRFHCILLTLPLHGHNVTGPEATPYSLSKRNETTATKPPETVAPTLMTTPSNGFYAISIISSQIAMFANWKIIKASFASFFPTNKKINHGRNQHQY
jgi:hypothetical protein